MQLVFQNSKELKQVRHFIKSLNYVYSAANHNEKKTQIFIYLSSSYIAIVNNFMENKIPDYCICFCILKNNMYQLSELMSEDEDGIIYGIQAQKIMEFLNTQMEPDTIKLTLQFPTQNDIDRKEKAYLLMRHDFENGEGRFKLPIKIQYTKWPFSKNLVQIWPQNISPRAQMKQLLKFPPKFINIIDSVKKYPQLWITLQTEGIAIKKTDNGFVVVENKYNKQNYCQFGYYNYTQLAQFMCMKMNLLIKSQKLFHHLSLSNKQNKQTLAYIIIDYNENNSQKKMKQIYLYLVTKTDKKETHEMFPINIQQQISERPLPTSQQTKTVIIKRPKKQDEQRGQRQQTWVINQFYGSQFDQTLRTDLIRRQGFFKQVEQTVNKTQGDKKFKIQ